MTRRRRGRRRSGRQQWFSAYSVDFDGADDLIHRTAGMGAIAGEFTVSAWYKPTASSGIRYAFVCSDGTLDNALLIYFRGDLVPARIRVYAKIAGVEVSSIADEWTNVGSWAHVAVTRDAADLVTFYLNGAAIHSGTCAGTLSCTKMSIGGYLLGAGSGYWLGRWSQIGLLTSVADVAWLAARPGYDLSSHPDCHFAANPVHVADSTAATGLIHDWTVRGQDMTPYDMTAADVVADAP